MVRKYTYEMQKYKDVEKPVIYYTGGNVFFKCVLERTLTYRKKSCLAKLCMIIRIKIVGVCYLSYYYCTDLYVIEYGYKGINGIV